MRWLVLVALLCSVGCAVYAKPAPLVRKGQTIAVIWAFERGAAVREILVVEDVRQDGWILGRNPGTDVTWLVNLSRALQFTDALLLPESPVSDDGVRERVALDVRDINGVVMLEP